MTRPDLSVVIMAFNEANNLRATTQEICGVVQSLGTRYELIIVDDGSTDGTASVADTLVRSLPGVRVINHPTNLGLGGVYRTGFSYARGNVITFFPADGQFPANIISRFFPLMESNELVLGYLPKRDSSILARFLSWAERVLYRCLFGHFPRFQGIMMFRRSLLETIQLKSHGRGWGVVMEFILRATGTNCRSMSVPTTMRPRLSGTSKVNNWGTMFANLIEVLILYGILSGNGDGFDVSAASGGPCSHPCMPDAAPALEAGRQAEKIADSGRRGNSRE